MSKIAERSVAFVQTKIRTNRKGTKSLWHDQEIGRGNVLEVNREQGWVVSEVRESLRIVGVSEIAFTNNREILVDFSPVADLPQRRIDLYTMDVFDGHRVIDKRISSIQTIRGNRQTLLSYRLHESNMVLAIESPYSPLKKRLIRIGFTKITNE